MRSPVAFRRSQNAAQSRCSELASPCSAMRASVLPEADSACAAAASRSPDAASDRDERRVAFTSTARPRASAETRGFSGRAGLRVLRTRGARMPARRVYIFNHVQKCAGTSLATAIFRSFACRESAQLYMLSTIDEFFPRWQRGDFREAESIYVASHFAAGAHALFPEHEPMYLTMLREPLARFLSAYRMAMDIGTLPDSFTPENYFAGAWPNYSTLAIGDGDLAEAKRRLEDEYPFVGITEEYERSAALLAHTFELPFIAKLHANPSATRARGPAVGRVQAALLRRELGRRRAVPVRASALRAPVPRSGAGDARELPPRRRAGIAARRDGVPEGVRARCRRRGQLHLRAVVAARPGTHAVLGRRLSHGLHPALLPTARTETRGCAARRARESARLPRARALCPASARPRHRVLRERLRRRRHRTRDARAQRGLRRVPRDRPHAPPRPRAARERRPEDAHRARAPRRVANGEARARSRTGRGAGARADPARDTTTR
ncbi:MAG: sulfotransferase family 2 domain-containing protein [Deltaproteobacteria bacterium]|nr:sulfotransferase family 2 domain-containing protein [Deltaproteobacteria bacterium]